MLPLMFGLNLSFLDVFLFLPKEGKARWWDFRVSLAKLLGRGMLMLRFCWAKAAREHGTQHGSLGVRPVGSRCRNSGEFHYRFD